MDPLSPPIAYFLLLSSGWINRQQPGSLVSQAGDLAKSY